MKIRNKLVLISIIAVAAFFVWPIPYNGICNLFENYDPCSRISGFEIPGVGMLHYDTTFGMIPQFEEGCELVCEDREPNYEN